MKRITAVLLALLTLLSLYACGDKGEQNTDSAISTAPAVSTPEDAGTPAPLPDNGPDTPSGTLLTEDITTALAEKNPHATLTSAEIAKSQTQETSYYVTLQIAAQSKYSDWQYEADLYYTKYDQGWILDRVDWVGENYELTRYPGTAEMVAYAEDYLRNHEVYSDPIKWKHAEYMLPMQNAGVGLEPGEDGSEPMVRLNWLAVDAGKYLEYVYRIMTLWSYDFDSDSWVLAQDKDSKQGYSVYDEYVTTDIYDLDYSGTRTLHDLWSMDPVAALTISDFSWEGMYVYIPEYMTAPEYFTRSFSNNLSSTYGYDNVFKSETGEHCIVLIIQSTHVEILYCTPDLSFGVAAMVEETLPQLQSDSQTGSGSTQQGAERTITKIYTTQIFPSYTAQYVKIFNYQTGAMKYIANDGIAYTTNDKIPLTGSFESDSYGCITYEELDHPTYTTYQGNGIVKSRIISTPYNYEEIHYNSYGLTEKMDFSVVVVEYTYEYTSFDKNGQPTAALATESYTNDDSPHVTNFSVTLLCDKDGRPYVVTTYTTERVIATSYLYDSFGNLVEQRSTYPEYTQVTTYVYE